MTDTTNFSAPQVLDALADWLEGDDWNGLKYTNPKTILLDGEQYSVEVVDQSGGMDEGSNATVTIKVGSQFFRKSGYYASHYGYDWDGDFREVRPVTKTVVVYE